MQLFTIDQYGLAKLNHANFDKLANAIAIELKGSVKAYVIESNEYDNWRTILMPNKFHLKIKATNNSKKPESPRLIVSWDTVEIFKHYPKDPEAKLWNHYAKSDEYGGLSITVGATRLPQNIALSIQKRLIEKTQAKVETMIAKYLIKKDEKEADINLALKCANVIKAPTKNKYGFYQTTEIIGQKYPLQIEGIVNKKIIDLDLTNVPQELALKILKLIETEKPV